MNSKKIEKSLKFIDTWLNFRWQRGDLPGFVVAISHKNQLIFNNAYGFSNLERKEKLKNDDIFRIASHSKTFTAAAIMQLVENGKIDLNDKIVNHLHWLRGHKDKRMSHATIIELLSHRAGIIRDGIDNDYWQQKNPFPQTDQFKEEILTTNLVIKNNTQMKYSNYGYTLLGLTVEAVSGISYKEYITKNIIEPLGLSDTGPDITKEIEDRLVTGYTRADMDKKRTAIQKDTDTNAMSSATGFYSTTRDMCKYFQAHIIGSGLLLKDASKKMMQTKIWKVPNDEDKEKYGLGLIITQVGKRTVFGHGGGFPGQITCSMTDPKNQLTVVVLTNCIDGPASLIAKGVISTIDYFEKNYILKGQNNFEKFEGRFVNLWGINDIISMGNSMVTVSPDSWNPLKCPEKLKYMKENTFKIAKTNGYYSEGELVHFKLNTNNTVESVTYAGMTMHPED